MVQRIKLPNNLKFKSCYDLIRQTTPGLYRSLNDDLLAASNKEGPADVRFQALPKIAQKFWADFLLKDTNHSSIVVRSSWECCIGDLADALLQRAISEITGSNDPKDIRRARLEALLSVVKTDLYDTPTNPGMVLDLTMALNSLG